MIILFFHIICNYVLHVFAFLVLYHVVVLCTFSMHKGEVHLSYFLLCSVNITYQVHLTF
jgi:hypothetical protein